ncbi:MAG TPA: VOC family protein [Gaiellaceae bacterium]|nr:VOC family protein [Gaiellaceae bacterium]
MNILALDHITMTAPPGSAAEIRAFYGDVFGLEEVPKPDTVPDGCWFQVGVQEIHVTYEEPFHPLRTAHPSFMVDDLAALVARLRAAGAEATPDDMIPGLERAFVRDPFGNRLELRQA